MPPPPVDTTQFHYLPNTPQDLAGDGYYHKLTEKQQTTLSTLQTWAIDNDIDVPLLAKHALHPTLTMLRYLRANKFDVDATMRHIQENLKWRRAMQANDVVVCPDPQLLLGCPVNKLTAIFPHWHCGYDLELRPVLYKQYTLFDAAAIKAIVPIEAIIRYHLWEQEVCMRLCKEQALRTGYIIETTTTIMDLRNMRMGQVTKDFLAFMRAIADVDKAQYPETLGRMIIINAPSVFPFVWRMVRVWLDPDVAAKIQVMGDEREWGPVLLALVGSKALPSTYGGSGPALDGKEHPYSEYMELMRVDRLREEEAGGLGEGGGSPRISRVPSSEASRMQRYKKIGGSRNLDEDFSTMGVGVEHTRSRDRDGDCDSLDSFASLNEDVFLDCHEGPHAALGKVTFAGHTATGIDWEDEVNYLNQVRAGGGGGSGEGGVGESSRSDLRKDEAPSGWACVLEACHRTDPIYVFEYSLRGFSSDKLRAMLGRALLCYCLIAISGMVLSAYAISTTRWISVIARVQMWTGVLLLLVSTSLLSINFAGFMGWYTDNKMMLKMYGLCLSAGFGIFLIIAIACFVFATTDSLAGYTDRALDEAISDPQTRDNAKAFAHQYNLSIGIGALFFSLLTMIPMALSFVLSRRWELHKGLRERCGQLRTVLQVTCALSLVAAFVMMVYGGACLKYLFSMALQPTVIPIFGLVYGGMSVILCSVFGLWVSQTVHGAVVRAYYRVVQPCLITVLLAAASLSLGAIPESGVSLEQHFAKQLLGTQGGQEDVVFKIQTQLLVAGVLCVFVCLFQLSGMHTTYKMSCTQSLIQAGEEAGGGVVGILTSLQALGSVSGRGQKGRQGVAGAGPGTAAGALQYVDALAARSIWDRAAIVWAVVMGVFCVFYDGTYAVLISGRVFSTGSDTDRFVWQALSQVDERYNAGDAFLVISSGISALVVGPLLLAYAWSLFVRAPFRHVCGIVPTLLLVIFRTLFYLIEIVSSFRDLKIDKGGEWAAVIFPAVFFLWLLPGLVLIKEARSVCRSVSAADTYEMIVSMEMEASQRQLQHYQHHHAHHYDDDDVASLESGHGESADGPRHKHSFVPIPLVGPGARRAGGSIASDPPPPRPPSPHSQSPVYSHRHPPSIENRSRTGSRTSAQLELLLQRNRGSSPPSNPSNHSGESPGVDPAALVERLHRARQRTSSSSLAMMV